MIKRMFCGLLALTLALCLAACGQDEPAAASSGANAGDAPAVPAGDALRILEPGTAAGRYTVGHLDGTYSGDGLLTYIDYGSLQQVALCADPNCDHTGGSCTARGPVSDLFLYGAWVVDDDTLVVAGYQPELGIGLWRCKADGSDPVALQCGDPQVPTYPLLFDGTYLYYQSYGESDDKDALRLYATPLYGGSYEKLFVLPGDSQMLLGCEGREILLFGSDYSARSAVPAPQPGENAAEDEINALWEQFYAQYYAAPVKNTLLYKNIDTGEERVLYAWEETGERFSLPPVCMGGHILFLDCEAPALREVLADGTVREWALPAVQEGGVSTTAQVAAVVGDVAVVDLSYNIDTAQEGAADELIQKRYAVDLASGECRELTLRYIDDGYAIPLRIVAASPDAVLVEFERQASLDGGYDYTSRCALLTVEDFLNSQPNYKELSTPYGPLVTDGKTS